MSIPSRILITGCTGFVGGYLVEQCRIRYPQAELFGLSGHPTLHTATPGMSDLELSVADVTQPEAVRQVVAEQKPDLGIHLAYAPFSSLRAATDFYVCDSQLCPADCPD